MERRRLGGGIALLVLVAILGGLVWYDAQLADQAPTTAFAPAQTPDESAAAPGQAATDTPTMGGTMAAPDATAAPPGDTAAATPPPAPTPPPADTAAATPPDATAAPDDTMAAAPPPAPTPPPADTAAATPPPDATAPPDNTMAAAPDTTPPADLNGRSDGSTETAMAAPDQPPAPPPTAPDAMPAPPGAPTFDVVRVEPSGDTVIAGQAEAGSSVEILDGQSTIATATADQQGSFAVTLDRPLAPGSHDLAIRTTSADKATVSLSDQRVAVAVPEPGSTDVLVVMNSPDSASKVLEVPGTGNDNAGTAAGSGNEVATNTPEAGNQPPAAVGTGTDAGATVAAPEGQVSEAAPPEAGTGAGGGAEAGSTESGRTAGEVASAPPSTESPPAGSDQAPGQTASSQQGAMTGGATGAEQTPAEVASAPPPAETPVTGNESSASTTTAAAAPPGTEAPANGETDVAVAPPSTEAPGAEPTAPGSDGVAAATEPQVAAEPRIATEPPVAAEPPASSGQEVANAGPDANKASAEPPVVETPKPAVTVQAVEADTNGNVFIAGTTTTGQPVRAYINDTPIGDATPSPSGTFLVETQKDMPAGTYTVRVDQLDEHGQVIARSEVPFEKEVEVAILTPTATADASAATGASVSGAMPEMETVIIKRRDNLWRIARRTWGKGVRWSTIYQANTDQIRNPHWIYPGQVFVMPKGSTNWTD